MSSELRRDTLNARQSKVDYRSIDCQLPCTRKLTKDCRRVTVGEYVDDADTTIKRGIIDFHSTDRVYTRPRGRKAFNGETVEVLTKQFS